MIDFVDIRRIQAERILRRARWAALWAQVWPVLAWVGIVVVIAVMAARAM